MGEERKSRGPKGESAEQRRARLAAELRANLARRKAQARARAGRDVAGETEPVGEDGSDRGG